MRWLHWFLNMAKEDGPDNVPSSMIADKKLRGLAEKALSAYTGTSHESPRRRVNEAYSSLCQLRDAMQRRGGFSCGLVRRVNRAAFLTGSMRFDWITIKELSEQETVEEFIRSRFATLASDIEPITTVEMNSIVQAASDGPLHNAASPPSGGQSEGV